MRGPDGNKKVVFTINLTGAGGLFHKGRITRWWFLGEGSFPARWIDDEPWGGTRDLTRMAKGSNRLDWCKGAKLKTRMVKVSNKNRKERPLVTVCTAPLISPGAGH